MRFEWDPKKAEQNFAKHGVSFEEATTAFTDPLSLTVFDDDPLYGEDRYVLVGASQAGRLLVVVHTDRQNSIRIINARLAMRGERRDYANF